MPNSNDPRPDEHPDRARVDAAIASAAADALLTLVERRDPSFTATAEHHDAAAALVLALATAIARSPRPTRLPIRAIVDLLEVGKSIETLAAAAGLTPIGLVIAGVQWLAEHPDEVTNDEHIRICSVLATALGPIAGPR